MTPTKKQIEELRKWASKATPGPWNSERVDFETGITFEIGPKHDGSYGFRFVLREQNYETERADGKYTTNVAKLKADAAFIAAANPAVILDLLARLEGFTEKLKAKDLVIKLLEEEKLNRDGDIMRLTDELEKFGVEKGKGDK